MADTPTSWIRELLDLADERGWWVVRIDARPPCSITVAHPKRDFEITIVDRHAGLNLRTQLDDLGRPA
jgi:hypothetical protein